MISNLEHYRLTQARDKAYEAYHAAETALEDAQEAFQKAEEAYEKAESDLQSCYNSGG